MKESTKTLTGPTWPDGFKYFTRVYFAWAIAAALIPVLIGSVIAVGRYDGPHLMVTLFVLMLVEMLIVRRRSHDGLAALARRVRRGGATAVSFARYAEGAHGVPVVVWLADTEFHYENQDLVAAVDMARILECEVDEELLAGGLVERTERVLRLRSFGGQEFEFVLPLEDAVTLGALLMRTTDQRRQDSRTI